MEPDLVNDKFTPSSKLNFIIGMCAMLISVASFYATYLQANSAEQQVKAMTYPLIQHQTNNYSIQTREEAISFVLSNNGVGPAIIRKVEYRFEGKIFRSVHEFISACCGDEFKAFNDIQGTDKSISDASIITASDRNIILPANDSTQTFYLLKHESNILLWNALNKARRKLNATICYCSLLENCYESKRVGKVEEVQSCDA